MFGRRAIRLLEGDGNESFAKTFPDFGHGDF